MLIELYVFIGLLLGIGYLYDQSKRGREKITATDVVFACVLVIAWFPIILTQLLFSIKRS